MSIPEKLLKIFNDVLEPRLSLPEVALHMMLDDLGLDDLDRQEIAMEIEDEYDTTVTDETANGWESVAEIAALVEALEEARA